MKQLVPTGLDEYLAEHKEGDTVTGRIIEVSGERARVELGEGVQAQCRIPGSGMTRKAQEKNSAKRSRSCHSPPSRIFPR